ncbi:hypothetical protein FPV67DRAFT_1484333 [Lyophyllum atratum]|nr:hypothetical protein FPV67DRAFT_1484333 [Lyophyllum atratum]
MLACRVVVGKPWIRRRNAGELTEAPSGCHSPCRRSDCPRLSASGGSLNYHGTIVYNNDAIRPAFLIVYGEEPEESSCVVS